MFQEFPLRSALSPEEYGPQESAIKPEHVESQLEGLTIAEVHFLNKTRGREISRSIRLRSSIDFYEIHISSSKCVEPSICVLDQAVEVKRLFIVDYHDIFMPFVKRINELEGRKIYAPRTLFFLHRDGILKPVAIELSLPPLAPGAVGSKRVFTPAKDSTGFWLWQLAKLHYCAADSGYHQLVSHW